MGMCAFCYTEVCFVSRGKLGMNSMTLGLMYLGTRGSLHRQ